MWSARRGDLLFSLLASNNGMRFAATEGWPEPLGQRHVGSDVHGVHTVDRAHEVEVRDLVVHAA